MTLGAWLSGAMVCLADQTSSPPGWLLFKTLAIIFGSIFGFIIFMAAIIALIIYLQSRRSMQRETFWVQFKNTFLSPFRKKVGAIKL